MYLSIYLSIYIYIYISLSLSLSVRPLGVAGKVITLYPFNYMRRLPLREGVSVGSSGGLSIRICLFRALYCGHRVTISIHIYIYIYIYALQAHSSRYYGILSSGCLQKRSVSKTKQGCPGFNIRQNGEHSSLKAFLWWGSLNT